MTTRRRKLAPESQPRPPLTVVVTASDGEPIDLDRWAEDYVRAVLGLEGIEVPVAIPPVRSVRNQGTASGKVEWISVLNDMTTSTTVVNAGGPLGPDRHHSCSPRLTHASAS